MKKTIEEPPLIDPMSNLASPEVNYALMAKSYGLQTPEQIKMRILWRNIQGLIEAQFGHDPESQELLRKYKVQWDLAEKEESRLIHVSRALKTAEISSGNSLVI